MLLFQSLLILLVCAVVLAACARYLKLPYPSLLALGGTALAFIPHAPSFSLDPQLTLPDTTDEIGEYVCIDKDAAHMVGK